MHLDPELSLRSAHERPEAIGVLGSREARDVRPRAFSVVSVIACVVMVSMSIVFGWSAGRTEPIAWIAIVSAAVWLVAATITMKVAP